MHVYQVVLLKYMTAILIMLNGKGLELPREGDLGPPVQNCEVKGVRQADQLIYLLLFSRLKFRLNNFYTPTLQVFNHFYVNDKSISEFCLVLSYNRVERVFVPFALLLI